MQHSNRSTRCTLLFSFLISALMTMPAAWAQSEQGQQSRVFGQGQPAAIRDLPPGQLRKQLQLLPAKAQAHGLRQLQALSFAVEDVESLRFNEAGDLYYEDHHLPPAKSPASGGAARVEAAPQEVLDQAFALHSRPGAPRTVYLDFDGHVIQNTAWNSGGNTLVARPFDTNGNPGEFNNDERTRIIDIWHRMSEDLAPFDIDVTTEEPASFDRYTGRVLFTADTDANGAAMPSQGAGGVAYVNVFGISNYHTYYSPALVYFNNLGSGTSTYNAEAGSHELGHNLGLSHDGSSGTTYYGGHGSGLVSWAPIMGNSYSRNVTQWSRGEYAGANQTQDDLAIIEGKLGLRPDDHGDTRATASALLIAGDGSVNATNPEFDPYNNFPDNKGIINNASDEDVFSMDLGDGSVDLSIAAAWDAFYRATSRRGANLDIHVQLEDASGNVLAASDPLNDTGASLQANVSAGTHYLRIRGVGNSETPYSNYNSQGMYFIYGSVVAGEPDLDPPNPDPMGWAVLPAGASPNSMSMTAVTATDDSGVVSYQFRCVAGGNGCSNSAWQSGTSYTATGLEPATEYTWQVVARDSALNETAPSVAASAFTMNPPPPPAAPQGFAATGISENAISLVWQDQSADEEGFRLERSAAGQGNWQFLTNLAANSESHQDNGLSASTGYDYRLRAFSQWGDSAWVYASGATQDPPPFTNVTANGEQAVAGSVSGSYTLTASDNGASQSITERQSGGKPSNRYSYLEHRWTFSLPAGETVTVMANAWSSGSSDNDTFLFEWSANGSSFQPLFEVSSEDTGNQQSAVLPGAPSGQLVVRVVDSDQTSGNRDEDTVFVDHLYVQVGSASVEPPDANPSGLDAQVVSFEQIDLSWNDNSGNEAGFRVERSLNGSSGWQVIAEPGANQESYSDTGLAPNTTYFYRVSAFNANGQSGYSSDSATTGDAPDLSLSASGFKTRGQHNIQLQWDGASNVDVYRNGGLIASGVSGQSYLDDTGNKGGASYEHQVCVAGSSTDCSNVTVTVF